nr:S8 family serine peptidase [Kribbella sandramycini]
MGRRASAVVVAGLLVVAGAGPGGAEAKKPPAPGAEQVVTLVTGDKVRVRPVGKSWDVTVEARAGRRVGFLQSVGPKGVTVIPADVAGLVKAGKLDRALFDVTGLIRQGYADAKTSTMPLLVQTDGRRSVSTLGKVIRQLPKGNLTAVATAKATAALTELPAGVKKVWLNAKAKPTLDASVAQVGAPAAWQAGHTGQGAKLAVLDTGYDTGHPDLAGVVTGSKDFTGEGIQDQVGHGTHVASTAAGRGTASGGKYTGVAKGADLLIGKVCVWDGCSYDAIIAGMQWAADSGAKVVNLSLGGEPSDGTDPLSQELNRISAASGTLFVVAAGNNGGDRTVTSPAAADRALAVGSVTKQDELSDFSSRGPRYGDFGLKPDLAAPGSDIVAARAKDTLDGDAVDASYARMSGTSMASPHVAGAAAILAAQHPDWTGDRIKDVLMSSAKPLDGIAVSAQGAGRLDVARADRQQVVADAAALQFGLLSWPHADRPAVQRKVSFRNLSNKSVALRTQLTVKDAEGNEAPAGFAAVDQAELTVPAGGQAVATVTVDPKVGPVGTYEGRLIARSADGTTVVQAPFGVHKEPESFDLDVQVTDRHGAALPNSGADASLLLTDLDSPDGQFRFAEPGRKNRLPKGRYRFNGYIYTADKGYVTPSVTVFNQPDFVLDADRRITVDARAGRPLRHRTDAPGRPEGTVLVSSLVGETRIGYSSWFAERAFAVPSTQPAEGFSFVDASKSKADEVRLTGADGSVVPVDWAWEGPRFTGSKRLRTVDVGHATEAELAKADVKGKLAMFTLSGDEVGDYVDRVRRLGELGAVATLNYVTDVDAWPGRAPELPSVIGEGPAVRRLVAQAGSWVTLTGLPQSTYRYELLFATEGGIPATLDRRVRDRDLIAADTTYYGPAGAKARTFASGSLNGLRAGLIFAEPISLPLRRTVLRSPAPVHWEEMLFSPVGIHHGEMQRAAGQVRTSWAAPAIGPSQPNATRDGDQVTIQLPLVSDSAGHPATALKEAYEGSITLWDGDRQVAHNDNPEDPLTAELPAERSTYRLSATAERTGGELEVKADWTFVSARSEPLQLLTVALKPPVAPDNSAPGGRAFQIPVSTQPNAQVKSVEYATDGKTWIKASLKDGVATVNHPAAGSISLRSTAVDANGNKVAQTTLNAYQVR